MPTPMALQGLSRPGDYTYQQYSKTFTRPLSTSSSANDRGILTGSNTGEGLNKGELYTTNSAGEIIRVQQNVTGVTALTSPAVTADVVASLTYASYRRGIFQALDKVEPDSDITTAQFMGRGSRVLHAVESGVSVGDLVGQNYSIASGTAGTYNINPNLVSLDGLSPTQRATHGLSVPGGTSIWFTIGTVIEIRSFDTSTLAEKFATDANGQLATIELGGY